MKNMWEAFALQKRFSNIFQQKKNVTILDFVVTKKQPICG